MSGTRKNYMDNIRWATILLVLVFHVFYYFNKIGTPSIFQGNPEYTSGMPMTFAGIFQYAVYPWFMVLLFIVSGMSTFYALKSKTTKDFMKSRRQKLLVPSLLGVLCFGWISGFIIIGQSAGEGLSTVPFVVKFIIATFSGIGALWFCHVVFIASLIVLLIRKIDIKINKEEKFIQIGQKANILFFIPVFFILWGSSKILNVPVITAYRLGIYIMSFLLGYYLFSQEKAIEVLKKYRFVTLILAIASGIYFVYRAYGTHYADSKLLSTWYSNLFVFFAVLAVFGISATYFNKSNKFTEFCSKESFAVYILHIPVYLVILQLLTFTNIPVWGKYLILFPVGLGVSLGLGMLIKKIPVLRFIILGIKSPKKADKKIESDK